MAGSQNTFSGGKRAKERLRAEKKAEKQERRRQRQAEKGDTEVPEGVDPDIAGIVPGPQPVAEEGEDEETRDAGDADDPDRERD